MDSNVKTGNTGAAASPESLLEKAEQLGFSSCTTGSKPTLTYAGSNGEAATHTVNKIRGFLQAQLRGKAGIPDENIKDYIFHYASKAKLVAGKLQGRVINHVT